MEQSMASPDDNLNPDRSARWITAMTLGTRAKSLLDRPHLIFNFLLLFVFSAAVIRELLYWFPKDAFGTGLNYWAYTDWLFDYSQGFIRRGLSGEIWRLVPNAIQARTLVAVFSWILILGVAFGYLRLLARTRKMLHPLTTFGLLFFPSLFFFYLHDHNAIARKEILGYLTVLLHLLAVEKSIPLGNGSAPADGDVRRYLRIMLPVAVILLPAIILIHEGSFLLFVPLHGMVTLAVLRMNAPRDSRRAALLTGLLYLPAALTFGAVYLAGTPSHQMLFAICEKWNAAGAIWERSCQLPPSRLSGSTLPASFEPMEWSLPQAASLTRMFISARWKDWLLILPTLGILLWYLVRQAVYSILRSQFSQSFSPSSALRYSGLFFRKYYLVPLVLALPVYLTAWDYGRWFTVTGLNFALVAVSQNLACREFALRKKDANEGTAASDSQEHPDNRLVFYCVSTIVCILALVLWLPHYCLFSCEIIRSPLEFFSHTFIAR